MNKRKRTILLLLLPVVLGGALLGVWWWRLHPPPTELDEQVRSLLLSADRVDVEIETILMGYGAVDDLVARLLPEEVQPVVQYINF